MDAGSTPACSTNLGASAPIRFLMKYLEELVKQLNEYKPSETASFSIYATEGQPAIVHLVEGPRLRILMQNESLTALECIRDVNL